MASKDTKRPAPKQSNPGNYRPVTKQDQKGRDARSALRGKK